MGKRKDLEKNLEKGKGKKKKDKDEKKLSAQDLKEAAKKARKGKENEKPATGLYVFSEDTFYPRRGQGPLVEPTFNIMKKSGQKEMYLGDDWQAFMRSINTPLAYDRIIAKDWAPSKGINDNGMLKFNALVYPGRNIVRILQVEKGKDDTWWGLIDSLDPSSVPVLDVDSSGTPPHPEYDAPHHYHTVYSCTKTGSWFYQDENVPIVPIIRFQEEQEQWVQMEKLKVVDLPKTVTISIASGVGVYTEPGDLTTQTGDMTEMQKAEVSELRIARGGIWGRIETGWIALRFNDKNQTDWII